MAKQSIDKATKEMKLDHRFTGLNNLFSYLNDVRGRAEKLQEIYNQLKDREAELVDMGTIYAGTTWKDGKYLYLIYPGKNGEDRQRVYVGSDSDKVAEALAAIERGSQLDKVKSQIKEMENRVHWCGDYIIRANGQIS
ncbi:MAG TPA: hypothetical protein VK974_07155 [Methylophilaceae bacterium]|nr:hypothetical protein [Methylophilaceae bacterium]